MLIKRCLLYWFRVQLIEAGEFNYYIYNLWISSPDLEEATLNLAKAAPATATLRFFENPKREVVESFFNNNSSCLTPPSNPYSNKTKTKEKEKEKNPQK